MNLAWLQINRLVLIAICIFSLAGAMIAASEPLPTDRAELERIATEHYDEEFLFRASEYSRARLILFFAQTGLILAILGFLVTREFGKWRRKALSLAGEKPWLARLFLLSTLYFGLSVIRLAFAMLRFFHAKHYALRHDSVANFLLDWSKGFAISWLMVIFVGMVVLALFASMPRWWWLFSGSIVAALAITYITMAPLVIDPLYYRFSKLENSQLENRLLNLGRTGGVDAAEIFVVDASKRSPAVNAYFTGFGKTQRIVLYDNLINKFDADEVALVVAHEIGHWREKHIHKGLMIGIAGLYLCLMFSHHILAQLVNNRIGGLSGRADPALAIPAYALYTLMTYIAIVPGNWVSRQMETEADRVSLELTQDANTFIQTKIRLARENLSNVLPPSWVESTLYSHPSNARRILAAKKFDRHFSSDPCCGEPITQ